MATRNKLCLDDARELDGEQFFFSVVAVSETASEECAPAAGVCSPGLQPPLLTLSV